jgi:uncharacterized membrane protein
MPPVHPDFTHFPIALLTVAFAAAIWAAITRNRAVAGFSWASLVLGFIGLLFTAGTGFLDMKRANLRHTTDELVDLHWKFGIVLTALALVLVIWQGVRRRRESPPASAAFLVYYAFVFLVLCFQGWYGGELAYAHGAGVAATGQGMTTPDRAAHRIEPAAAALRKLPWFGEHERESDESR